MDNSDRHERAIKRQEERLKRAQSLIDERQQRVQARLNAQQERLQARMDRINARLGGKLNTKQSTIVDSALELLNVEGLANLSLREIAKKLDMQAPALYWHFKNKDTLVDYMAEAILQKEFHNLQPRADDQAWQDWLQEHMLRLRKAMLAYTDGARVVAGAHPDIAVTLGQTFETALASLHSAGFTLQQAAVVAITATTYTFGYVIEEQSSPTTEQMKSINFEAITGGFPLTTKLLQELHRGENRTSKDPQDDFTAGLQLIISGASK